MNKWLSLGIKFCISSALIVFIVYKIGWVNILSSLKAFNFLWLIPALFFWICTYLLNAANIHALVNMEGHKISFWDTFRFYCMSMAISFFVPGIFGQASIIALIKKNMGSWGESAGIFLLDRSWVLLVVLFGAAGSAYIVLSSDVAILFIFGACLIGIAYVFFLLTGIGNRIAIKIFRPLVPNRLKPSFDNVTSLFAKYSLNKRTIRKNVLFSVLRWASKAMFFFSLLVGFGVLISPIYTYIVGAWEALIALVPISFAGLGLREGVGLFLYGKLGVSAAVIGAMYFFVNIFIYVTAMISFLLIKKEDFSWRALFAREKE